jgi:hypothetical protein
MTRFPLLISAILALSLLPQAAQAGSPMSSAVAQIAGRPSDEALNAFARRGEGGARVGGGGGARVGGGGGARTANISRGHHQTANVNRNVNRNVSRNVNVNRNIARVGVGGAVVRPVRPWVRRPYYGTVIAGVTLGTIIAASTIPPAPSSDLCWYWSNSSHSRGYWDYCQ